ncbi:adenine nucleotide alpha hydrolases-like protein [Cutaneotrichosporon oleaginosum]|uniref:Diphthine--ammonia ligase n=1 Tax=Cutaneotrichosporon oleaginosum TaxID=879819 RepID=A0A0J0XBX0_9TREE|nr:adenine nucleotide alpha hydrolases-like protein [Cutaneotrichosporon oleaginosum]KLT38571.1 adenine nucleotide alpha hydrolases-like protein [Cutaneotrichosporon oleaginosum]TXT08457.1 hypothetical protein COLE_05381 [Cutaneotrichosporon oleaginosum]
MVSPGNQTLPGVKHKVIGLVSGGKDSCFNLMHAVANGHEIVALATLTPEEGVDELDSHMYQSVGTALPPLIAQAMGLPHYSGIIRGKPVEQRMEYGSREHGGEGSGREGDETEDLTVLLRTVLAAHPEATAVSSGAILSNYQRLRIEHVCQRLGLTSLSYLWQSSQLSLVSGMISSGLDAVLIKVAGIGLKEQHVGKSLSELYPLLMLLQSKYGLHPAGEGGEYETLTLDTPLFSHRIRIIESEVVVTDPEPNLVAYMRVKKAELEPKAGWVRPSVSQLRKSLRIGQYQQPGAEGLDGDGLGVFKLVHKAEVEDRSDLNPAECDSHENSMEIPFMEEFEDGDTGSSNGDGPKPDGGNDSDGARKTTRGLRPVTTSIRRMQGAKGPYRGPKLPPTASSPQHEPQSDDEPAEFSLVPPASSLVTEDPNALRFVNRGRWFAASATGQGEGDVADELRAALDSVKAHLTSKGLSLPVDAVHVTLLLASMSDFAAVNAAYIKYFGTSPPSRACVGCPLPGQQRIRIEIIGFDGRPRNRPVGDRTALHVQGLSYWAPANIGPYSQAVIVDSRVHIAGQIPLQPASLTIAPYPAACSPYGHQAALALQHVSRIISVLRCRTSAGGGWEGSLEGCVAWWARPQGCGAEGSKISRIAWKEWAETMRCLDAPVLFVRAAELPRGALVEYQVNLHTGRPGYNHIVAADDDDDDDDEEKEFDVFYSANEMFPGSYREMAEAKSPARGTRSIVFFQSALVLRMPYLIKSFLNQGSECDILALRVYHRGELPDDVPMLGRVMGAAWTAVPVLDVQDRNGVSYPLALDVLAV